MNERKIFSSAIASLLPRERGRKIILLSILALSLAIKLLHLSQVYDHPLLQTRGTMDMLDSHYYEELGLKVAAGDLAAGEEVFFLNPFYVYFLGLIYALLGPGLLAPLLIQAIIGTAAVFLCYLIAAELFDERAGLVAAGLALLDGVLTFSEITLLPAGLDPFLTALIVFLFIRAFRNDRWTAWTAGSITLGIFALNRPNALILIPAASLLPLIRGKNLAGLFTAVSIAAVSLLVISPVTWRNYIKGHDLVLISSHGGLNFYIGNGPDAEGTYHAPPGVDSSMLGQIQDTKAIAEKAMGRPLKPSEVSSYYYQQTRDYIVSDPARFCKLLLRKTLYLCNAAEVALNYSYNYFREQVSWPLLPLVIGFGVLLPLGLCGAILSRGRARLKTVPVLFGLVYSGSLVIFFISSRYRLPLHIILIPLAAGGALDFVKTLQEKNIRRIIYYIIIIIPTAALANRDYHLPVGYFESYQGVTLDKIMKGDVRAAHAEVEKMPEELQNSLALHRRLGRAYAAKDFYEEALLEFEKVFSLGGREADDHYQLGRTLRRLGRVEQAMKELQTCIEMNPRHGMAHLDLALALISLGRKEEAVEHMRMGASLLPQNAPAHYDLGKLLYLLGSYDEALAELERAEALGMNGAEVQQALETVKARAGAKSKE